MVTPSSLPHPTDQFPFHDSCGDADVYSVSSNNTQWSEKKVDGDGNGNTMIRAANYCSKLSIGTNGLF